MKRKVYLLFPNAYGGVREVCETIEFGLILQDVEVIKINSFYNGIIKIPDFFKNNPILITNLQFGIFGVFSKRSVFIMHGYPMIGKHKSWIGANINALIHNLFSRLNKESVAVSYLIRFVARSFLNVRTTNVIHNHLPKAYLDYIPSRELSENSIVYLGRVEEYKGLDQIIVSFRAFIEQNPLDYKLYILGTGSYLEKLKSNYYGEKNIVFLGYVSDSEKIEILEKSRIFISLNEGEPFGITSIEADYFGLISCLPVVGGHNEVLKDSSIVRINDVNNIDEIAKAMFTAHLKSLDTKKNQFFTPTTKESYIDYSNKYINLF